MNYPLITAAVQAEKVASRRAAGTLIGAGLGALSVSALEKRQGDTDKTLLDLGVMHPAVYLRREAERKGKVLRGALAGGALGLAAGHYAPSLAGAAKTHTENALRAAGERLGEGAVKAVAPRAQALGHAAGAGAVRGMAPEAQRLGHELGKGAVEGAGHAAQEAVGRAETRAKGALRTVLDRIRGK